MRRTNVTNRETAINDFFEHFKRAPNVAEMNMKNTDLSGNHAADTNLSQKVKNILHCWERRTMIAQGNLDA